MNLNKNDFDVEKFCKNALRVCVLNSTNPLTYARVMLRHYFKSAFFRKLYEKKIHDWLYDNRSQHTFKIEKRNDTRT